MRSHFVGPKIHRVLRGQGAKRLRTHFVGPKTPKTLKGLRDPSGCRSHFVGPKMWLPLWLPRYEIAVPNGQRRFGYTGCQVTCRKVNDAYDAKKKLVLQSSCLTVNNDCVHLETRQSA